MEIFSILKWVIVTFTVLITLYVALCYIRYRLPSSQAETIEGEVFYKFLDTEFNHRAMFEETLLGKSSLRLSDRSRWFVNANDLALAWPESPHDMSEKGYTMSVTLHARPLRFGGYGPAKIVTTRRLDKAPIIGK